MMHLRLKPIIFVLNNGGYTIERFLHGPTRSFNDTVNWYEHELSSLKWCFPKEKCRRWAKLLDALSDETAVSESYKVTTRPSLIGCSRSLTLERKLLSSRRWPRCSMRLPFCADTVSRGFSVSVDLLFVFLRFCVGVCRL